MSVCEPAELQRPGCGHRQEVKLWSSLNVGLDPEVHEVPFVFDMAELVRCIRFRERLPATRKS